jgi:urease accessory protein
MAGLMDRLLGLDHLLALLLAGMWAGRLRGPELWALPAAFLAGTVPGFALAADQVAISLIEGLVHLLILASLVSLAAALLTPLRLPTRESMSTVAMIGGCHGYIHGVEIGSEQAMWFGLGALASAAALLASGVAVGLAAPQVK